MPADRNSSSNYFIVDAFRWPEQVRKPGKRAELVNRYLGKFGVVSRLAVPAPELMTTVEQRMNLYHLVSQVLAYRVPGAFVELGCNEGQSSVLIQQLIQQFDPGREFHVFDSFEGLPALKSQDGATPYGEAAMKTSKDRLLANFETYHLPPPLIHQGWFDQTLPAGLPGVIAFAYLDGDLYESTLVSLQHVYPRLASGAICVIDDYCDPAVFTGPDSWPGVKKACDEFMADKPEKVIQLYSGSYPHGFFRRT